MVGGRRAGLEFNNIHGHSRHSDTPKFSDDFLHYKMKAVTNDLSKFKKKGRLISWGNLFKGQSMKKIN